MAKKDPRIDTYIEKAAPFAKPVLKHFRQLIHKTCSEVEEKWKWSFPHFDYAGGPLAHMASFKEHCAVGFWKAQLIEKKPADAAKESGMSSFGRITSLKDLPKDSVLVKYIHEAMKLKEMGVKIKKKPVKATDVEPPDYFLKALNKNKTAKTTFDNFSNTNKKEYVSWVTEAKTEETRQRRLETAIEWMSEGKIRNWKYVK